MTDQERMERAAGYAILLKRYESGVCSAVLAVMIMNAEMFHDACLFKSAEVSARFPAAVQVINQHQRPLMGMALLCN